ncbi:MAG TPA: choice-of-anchor I family protein [Vicinamibacteria bacterium]|nr:choice-of-anchor I family protein [Vicinamibacteria bacterium]
MLARSLLASPGAATLVLALLPAVSSAEVRLSAIGSYATGVFAEGAAEIVAHDPRTQRLFVVNARAASVDVLEIWDPAVPQWVGTLDVAPHGAVANSVAVRDGLVAVAVESWVKTDPGRVVFYDAAGLRFLGAVEVGALPDMLVFTPDGRYVLVANEGEPGDDYAVDPEGSVSVIDMTGGVAGLTQARVRTAGFRAFDASARPSSLRVFGPGATLAQDLEPEYVAVSEDSRTAWVTLQESNGLAVVDVEAARVTRIVGLGFKNHRAKGNGLDASDRDGAIRIARWPVRGLYLPDAIAAVPYEGRHYLLLANEGDSRDYPGFSEEARVGGLRLDPEAFPDAAFLQRAENLGRLKVTATMGDRDGDGDYDALYSFGARSFSVRSGKGALLYDSGDELERVTAAALPDSFNASYDNNRFDDRSDDKGPEPEGLAVGWVGRRRLAFVGLERIGGVAVYDVTVPFRPAFLTYANNRDFGVSPGPATVPPASPSTGDLGPEGLLFIGAEASPNGKPLLVMGNEISGTTTVYEVSAR